MSRFSEPRVVLCGKPDSAHDAVCGRDDGHDGDCTPEDMTYIVRRLSHTGTPCKFAHGPLGPHTDTL